MPGLNPLMNQEPRQQIPNEAPSYFSPFFEQKPQPPPVAIWQPPNIERSRRSKVPVNISRTPVAIPTAGTWTGNHHNPHENKQEENNGGQKHLFQPKKRKSLEDDIMWLGQVSGFSGPPPKLKLPAEQSSVRSRLVRKPEEKPSQASALTGPRALEERKKREEEEKAREERLAQWATKKKKSTAKSMKEEKEEEPKQDKKHVSGDEPPKVAAEEWLPQPVESDLRSTRSGSSHKRGKVFIPQPQPIETTFVRSKHRPNLPRDDISYAPSNPILPQPIETVRRSNRPSNKTEKAKEPDEQVWFGSPSANGLPQPVESSRRSNRKSPLSKVASPDDQPSRRRSTVYPAPSDHVDHLAVPTPNETTGRLDDHPPKAPENASTPSQCLPQPIETTKKSSRASKASDTKEILPQPIESTKRSSKEPPKTAEPVQEILPQPVETTKRSSKEPPKTAEPVLPQPVESTRKSNRPAAASSSKDIAVPQPIESSRRTNRPVYRVERRKEILPEPIASVWKSTRGINKVFLPEPVESTRRSNRPAVDTKEILPEPVESTRRSNRPTEPKDTLPQPVQTTRRSNRPNASPLQDGSPPTPTTSFFGPDIQRDRSHSVKFARHPPQPLVAVPTPDEPRTRMRHGLDMHIELPQPISVGRLPGGHGGPDRPAQTPGGDFNPRSRKDDRAQEKKKVWVMPDDHFSHWGEPIDSQPPSPEGQSPERSPESSKCPSLSSSPTSSANSLWDISATVGKGNWGQAPKDLGISHVPEQHQPQVATDGDNEYPFPELPNEDAEEGPRKTSLQGGDKLARSDSSETIRPPLRAYISDPTHVASAQPSRQPSVDDYPICHSPVYEKFNPWDAPKRPEPPVTPGPDEDEQHAKRARHESPPPAAAAPAEDHDESPPAIRVDSPPTPPDSVAPSPRTRTRSHSIHVDNGAEPRSLSSAMYRGMNTGAGASPGYTVASLPPKVKRVSSEDAKKEVTDQFVDAVCGYLSLGFESIARKFDPELAEGAGMTVDEVRQNRKEAVRRYCEMWVQEHPSLDGAPKGGFW